MLVLAERMLLCGRLGTLALGSLFNNAIALFVHRNATTATRGESVLATRFLCMWRGILADEPQGRFKGLLEFAMTGVLLFILRGSKALVNKQTILDSNPPLKFMSNLYRI